MKGFTSLCYCLLVLPVFSQNKISEQELKRYEWIVYNKSIDDSSEIFSADTLLLAKAYELESLEQISGEDGQRIDELYSRSWRIDFVQDELDVNDQINEFYVFFIDLRKAAIRRSMEVDSITYQLLLQDPNTVTSRTAPVLLELEQMQNGDVIQMVDPFHNQFYYIEKTGNKLHVLKNLARRYIHEPRGLNSGFWTFSKRNQLMTFSDEAGKIHFLFRVERIDHIRIRLIHTLHPTKKQ
ncbi:MAG: hypothetical protein K0S23_2732 [Fluviicola sp.]|uniref:hypothetical protein n=1 Tax=Fluviicola sp. TaxID=1917219 RepID=UPI0026154ADB|nr:hypothetical protein [Fluviicola sp.]MDF3028425.1 hypothetical protein [Fluviicola sp.]